ncbi:histidine phosphatase family protein [Polaromonas sp.]|uniref:histidine phosphatase family protein n=1 Tax=Polaromonas sp. TaxID=1869339 RepID=UPI002FCC448C
MGAHKLWLVRHAQPLLEPGVCYGRLDVAADPQATRICAEALAEVLPSCIAVISSPLQRCELLAQALQGLRADLTYKTDARLQEMDFGDWEGRRWSDIPQAALAAWTARFGDHAVGGHGETVAAVMARTAAAFDELSPATDTLWITHAGVMRAAGLIARGVRQVARADQWPVAGPAYGQWCTLDLHLS